MYGRKTIPYLTLIAARLGRRLGHFMLCVLLLNFLSTAALSATAADRTEDFLSASDQSFIICTPQGLKRITLDKNGNPTQDDEGNLDHCVYCLPFHKGIIGAAFRAVDSPVVDPVSYRLFPTHNLVLIPDAPLNMSCPPRAPPVILES